MKAFAANKQLESWKAESQRAMDQMRADHDAAMSKLHGDMAGEARVKEELAARSILELRRELEQTSTRAAAMKRQIEASFDMIGLVRKSVESIEQAEQEMTRLRERAMAARRTVIEQAAAVGKALKQPETPPSTTAIPAAKAAPVVAPAPARPAVAPKGAARASSKPGKAPPSKGGDSKNGAPESVEVGEVDLPEEDLFEDLWET
jgi:hypothetical protein